MAIEEMIKGKRSRYYNAGYIWVSEDGTVVAEILPRERRLKDSYDKLVKFLADEMNITLTIKSRNFYTVCKIRLKMYTRGY